jgi:hypothetical protein
MYNLAAEIITVVKVPISQIAEWIKSQHDLPEKLESFNLEGVKCCSTI